MSETVVGSEDKRWQRIQFSPSEFDDPNSTTLVAQTVKNSAIPLLGIHTEKTRRERDTSTPMFIAALFIIARTWKQSSIIKILFQHVIHRKLLIRYFISFFPLNLCNLMFTVITFSIQTHHILTTEQSHVASGYHTGQHKFRLHLQENAKPPKVLHG